jgi:hypothetical protein
VIADETQDKLEDPHVVACKHRIACLLPAAIDRTSATSGVSGVCLAALVAVQSWPVMQLMDMAFSLLLIGCMLNLGGSRIAVTLVTTRRFPRFPTQIPRLNKRFRPRSS